MTRKRFSPAIYRDICQQQANTCAGPGCARRIPCQGMAYDHAVPLWAGGKDVPENLQALCETCHAAKTKREAFERAKADRIRAKLAGDTGPRGGHRRKAKIQSRGFDKTLRRKLDGRVEVRQ